MTDYPAAEFHLDGEPAAIKASAARWTAFGTAAREAATQIRSLDNSLFVGPEGDQYRAGLNQELPPHLDTTAKAYTTVGTTLTGYARALTDLQDRMAPLRVKAPALWAALQQAQHRVSTAQTDDHQHQLHTDPDSQAPDAYQSQLGPATTRLSGAEHAWNICLTAARTVKTDLRAAIEATDRAIRDAADLRFAHNPHGIHALTNGFKNLVTDHATGLSQLSGALKIVSGIAGVLSLIPVVGEVALAVSLVTAGAALLIDASLKYATGGGSWTSIAIDGTLLALPLGVGKGLTALRGARAAENLAETGAQLTSAAAETGAATRTVPTAAEAADLIKAAKPVGSALKADASHRSASFVIDDIAQNGTTFSTVGGDGVERLLVQTPGEVNGVPGRFEWMVDGGNLTHQMFVRGGTINGIPIKP